MATALMAWLRAPPPTPCTSTLPAWRTAPAIAPATEFGLDRVETLSVSMSRSPGPTPASGHPAGIRRGPLRHLPDKLPELPIPAGSAVRGSVAQRDRLVERVELTLSGHAGLVGDPDADLLEDLLVDPH